MTITVKISSKEKNPSDVFQLLEKDAPDKSQSIKRDRQRKICRWITYFFTGFLFMCIITSFSIIIWRRFPCIQTLTFRLRGHVPVTIVENVETDFTQSYERIKMPSIINFKASTTIHDFDRNLSAIVDFQSSKCFVLPLNRTIFHPPKDFLDIIYKMKTGYFLLNSQHVENMRIQFPAVEDLDIFGGYISLDCQGFQTFRLVKIDRKKRSTREQNLDFCLGGFANILVCVSIEV